MQIILLLDIFLFIYKLMYDALHLWLEFGVCSTKQITRKIYEVMLISCWSCMIIMMYHVVITLCNDDSYMINNQSYWELSTKRSAPLTLTQRSLLKSFCDAITSFFLKTKCDLKIIWNFDFGHNQFHVHP